MSLTKAEKVAYRQRAIETGRTVYGPMDKGAGPYWLSNGSELYRVIYRVGRKQRTKAGHRNETAARRWQRKNAVDVDTGKWIDTKTARETFGPFAEKWFTNYKLGIGARRKPRDSTVIRNESVLRNHVLPYFADAQFREFDLQLVEGWLAKLATKPARSRTGLLSQSMIVKCYRLLSMILKSAVSHHKLPGNPCTVEFHKEKPDTSKYEDIADPNLVRSLADHMRDEVWSEERRGRPTRRHRAHAKYRALILLAGFCGTRWGEAIALRRRDVDLAAGTVRIRRQVIQVPRPHVVNYLKTDAGHRTVDLPIEVAAALRHHLDRYAEPGPDGRLWSTRTRSGASGYLRASNFRRDVWLPAKRALELSDGMEDLVFHDLRHAAGTFAASHGVSIRDNQYRLGHASEAAALRYQHSTAETRRQAAARIDAALQASAPAATGTDGRHLRAVADPD